MEPAPLLPRPDESAASPPTARELLVCCDDRHAGAGIDARRGLVEEGLLTAVHEQVETIDLIETPLGRPRLAADNPLLSQQTLARLDPSGIIRVGSIVAADTILASVVVAVPPRPGCPEPEAGMQWVRDGSFLVPIGSEGARVTAVERRTRKELGRAAPPKLVERIIVTLRGEYDLAAGDVLLADGVPLGVVGRLVPDEAMRRVGDRHVDLVVPAAAGARLGLAGGAVRGVAVGRAAERGAAACQARSMEWYSLISLQPLGKSPAPGQLVGARHVRWLRSRGLTANLAELVSLKCDDLASRQRLRALLLQGDTPGNGAVPEPGAPESLLILQAWLLGLGLDVQLAGHDGHVDLTVRPATTEEVLARSSGAVRLPETIDYRTYDDMERGLFCPKVFGPSQGPRRRRFGHVVLPVPVVPLLWRSGASSVLERLLELPAETIEQIVHYEATVDCTGDQVRVDSAPPEPPPLSEQSGGAAIRALLLRMPAGRLPPALRGRADALVQEAVLLLPPDLRPLVLLDSGNFATADVNDLYRRIINRRNRLGKLIELNAPAAILAGEGRQLQEAADAVWANRLMPKARAVLGSAEGRLRDCLDMVVGHLLDRDAKRVDWSGQARAVTDASVAPGQVRVPRRIVEELRLLAAQPVLLTAAEGDGSFVAVLPEAHDEAVLLLAPDDFERLGLGRRDVPACLIHRPLGRAACGEAARLREGDPGPVVAVPLKAGWVDGASAEEIVTGLIEAALSGEPVHLETPRGLLLGGAGAVEAPADPAGPDEGRREPELRQVPVPAEPTPKRKRRGED
jgi:hypothetical protein